MAVLLVDAANVIGSRPTGWWRDRPGAARAFVEHVRAAVGAGRLTDAVVVVLEGAGRHGVEEGLADGVEVVPPRAGTTRSSHLSPTRPSRSRSGRRIVRCAAAPRFSERTSSDRGGSLSASTAEGHRWIHHAVDRARPLQVRGPSGSFALVSTPRGLVARASSWTIVLRSGRSASSDRGGPGSQYAKGGTIGSVPTRIQLRRTKGWHKPARAVVVSRPSRWGNPFRIGIDGDRAECVARYRRTLENGELGFSVADVRRELRGRDLACWCGPSEPCHAEVLLDLANRP